MRVNNFIKGSLLVLTPLAFFWGCTKGNAPVGPASASVASITVPLKDSHGKDLSATQVSVLYYIAGTGAPVTGNAGTASASTGNSFSFDVKLPSGNSYSYVAVQINDAGNNLIAAGATTLAGSTVPVTLGPVNKPVYQVTLGAGSGFGFESDSIIAVGANSPATVAGLDVVCNTDSTGFELDDSALTNDTIAYLGNGNYVNYLQLPSTFAESSSASKSQFATGPSSMAPGDVYCVKLSGGGHAWLQVVSVSVAGPAFVYRVNTTLPYCGYEQTTADAAAIAAGPTPTATVFSAAVTVAASYSISGAGAPYDVAIWGPTNGQPNGPATIFIPDSTNGFIYAVPVSGGVTGVNTQLSSPTTSMLTPIGLAIDSTGTYLYAADPGRSVVNQFQISGYTSTGHVGGGTVVLTPDNSTQASTGALASPRYVALDNTGDLFITDSGTGNVADVMEYLPTIPLSATINVKYWNDSLSSAAITAIGQVAMEGTTVVVANSSDNKIDFYSSAGVSIAPSLSSDNNTGNVVNFNNPQGVAYSPATGLLYISDTGNNRIVEMYSNGTFVKILSGTSLGLSSTGPTGIKLDNAQPPNIYVADTGNNRVLMLQ